MFFVAFEKIMKLYEVILLTVEPNFSKYYIFIELSLADRKVANF